MENIPPEFRITLADGTTRDDLDAPWKDISYMRKVNYFGKKKTVYVCASPIKHIEIFFEDLETSIDVPEDCEAYYATRARTNFIGGAAKNMILGRCVGLVKNDEVIEEKFINGIEHEVQGMKL